MPVPYFETDGVALYLGDCREILPALDVSAEAVVTDPPYGDTHLGWDTWPDGWPAAVSEVASAVWCFASLRMLLAHAHEFAEAGYRLAQDVVWEKNNGPGFVADRFRRVHELVVHYYRGPWNEQRHQVPRVPGAESRGMVRRRGASGDGTYGWRNAHVREDDGMSLQRSVIKAASVRAGAHPTQKPAAVLGPLIEYSTAPGALVVDPFAGSGATLETARALGRGAVGIEADEAYAEAAAARLSQGILPLEA